MINRINQVILAVMIISSSALYLSCNDNNPIAGNDDPQENDSLSVTDIDGNTYQSVKIGEQWWMAENLKVTHFRDGSPIPDVTLITEWIDLTTPGQCTYNNESQYLVYYGRLYNWYAVNDSRNIAPEGWHIPSLEEWQTLIDYLGGESTAGGKLKSTGTNLWLSPNRGATNESGFSANPAGCRDWTGHWTNVRLYAYFWSSDEAGSIRARYISVDYYYQAADIDSYEKAAGYSIRCIRD